MTRKENELMEIPYNASFKEMFTLDDNMDFLLNSMSVYGCVDTLTMGKMLDKPVNFDIRVINGKKVIYPLEYADEYFLLAKKLASATVLKNKTDEPKYDFHVGDFVEDIHGNVGCIDFICECKKCKERGFNEPRIRYTSGETDYITVYQLEHLDKSYRRIGKYEFKKKTPIIKSIDSIIVIGTTDEDKPFKMTFCDFDKDKAEIESVNDNGKKTLSLIINGGYSMKIEQ